MFIEDVTRLNNVAARLAKCTNNAVRPRIPKCNEANIEQNCWGFTAQALGWVDEPVWLSQGTMERMLAGHTVKINKNKVMPGDIVVFRKHSGELLHTAIILNKSCTSFIHKAGGHPITVCDECGYVGAKTYVHPTGENDETQNSKVL